MALHWTTNVISHIKPNTYHKWQVIGGKKTSVFDVADREILSQNIFPEVDRSKHSFLKHRYLILLS